MACGTRGTTASEKPADRVFANVPFYYLVSRGTCANFTLASTRRRRMSGKQGFNRNNFNTRWPRCGHGIRTDGPDTARVYLMSHSQFRPSKLRMAPMIKICPLLHLIFCINKILNLGPIRFRFDSDSNRIRIRSDSGRLWARIARKKRNYEHFY